MFFAMVIGTSAGMAHTGTRFQFNLRQDGALESSLATKNRVPEPLGSESPICAGHLSGLA
jgi:hypothetical protein